MSVDLIVFLVAVVVLLFIGLPTIRNTVTLPAELAMEAVPCSQLSKALITHFTSLDRELSELNFRALDTFRVTNLGSDNMLRLYLHADRQTFALATCLAQNTPDGRIGENYLEFIDEFADGRSLTSRNSDMTTVFVTDPRKPVIVAPSASPDELFRLHREARQQYAVAGRTWQNSGEILERGRDSHREMCEYQVANGRLEFDPVSQRFRATWKLAFIGVVNFLNPITDHFTWFRFVCLVTMAGVISVVGTTMFANLVIGLSLSSGETQFLLTVGRVFLYALVGGVVGWTFPGKVFIWSFLATYLPQISSAGSSDWAFAYSLWAAFIGQQVSSRLLARRDLLRSRG